MLADAVADELILANPAARIKLPENAPVRAARVPTAEQLAAIIARARPDAQDVIRVVAALGLRRGEVFALRWGDVDLDARIVHVRATNHRGRVAERTKTAARTRLVPLFRSAEEVLLARKLRLSLEREESTEPDAFVFANAIGGALDPGNWYRREWTPAVRAAGGPAFHFHDLRHFAASTLDEQGMGGKLRTEIIGHADEKVTNGVYTHISRARIAAAADQFDPLAA
jgi:integrase